MGLSSFSEKNIDFPSALWYNRIGIRALIRAGKGRRGTCFAVKFE